VPDDNGWLCQVTVDGHTYRVMVNETSARRWSRGPDAVEIQDLVRRSFDFLLEREAAGSILPRFELAEIERYFPEFDQAITR
jgi:hypothetical protein